MSDAYDEADVTRRAISIGFSTGQTGRSPVRTAHDVSSCWSTSRPRKHSASRSRRNCS